MTVNDPSSPFGLWPDMVKRFPSSLILVAVLADRNGPKNGEEDRASDPLQERAMHTKECCQP